MIKKGIFIIGFVILITVSGGCASSIKKFLKPMIMTPEERAGRNFFQKGQEFETKGNLVAAHKQYRLAMTADPPNKEAVEGLNRVEKKLRHLAKKNYRKGLRLYKKGKYDRARHQFLIALRPWPDYPAAVKMLTSRKRFKIKRYIVHMIRPGESLSRVAMTYYGDYQKFPIIAKYNNFTDATRVEVGQEIKVPEIEGIEFLVGKENLKIEKQQVLDPGIGDWEKYASKAEKTEKASGPKGALETKEAEETRDIIEIGEAQKSQTQEEEKLAYQISMNRERGIDLFKKKRYVEANAIFDAILKKNPNDRVALEYAHRSHFDHAVALFKKKDYLAARDQFEESLLFKADSEECYTYIEKSENLFKEAHYKKGVQFFGKERLIEAIKEWELVRAVDPNYKRVDYLINKAQTILKNVERIKESQRQQSQKD